MNRIKQLQELRGAKAKEARTLIDKANTEKRALTDTELNTLNGLHKDIEGLDNQCVAEMRQLAIEGQRSPALSAAEQRDLARFDYGTLVRHLHRTAKGQPSTLSGIEAELVAEGETEARAAGLQSGGLFLPRLLVRRAPERRDMTATGTTSSGLDQGGMVIATAKAGLLDDFYAASVMRAGGATILEGLVGNIDLPRIVAGTAPAKKAEGANADEVSPGTAMLSLEPNRLPAYVDISERLLLQSGNVIELAVRSSLTNQMLAVQEAAFFHGGGTSEANGIAGTAGIGSVAGDTNGAAPTLAHIIALETAVDTNNALLGNLHYASNGQIRGKLKQTPRIASTDSRVILEDNGLVNGYQPLWTNAISRTLTKGNQSLSSAIFFGNFADYVVGYWGGISLEMVRDKANAVAGLYTLVATAYYDGGVVRPKSFAAMLDALGA